MDAVDIRQRLEAEYDIPFVVHSSYENGEPCYVIGPQNDAKEFFTIKVSFRNSIRLHMDFQPEKYSAPFINAMAVQSEDNKSRFVSYFSLLKEKGAKADIRVNGIPFYMENWPQEWHNLQIHVTKMPVFENGNNYPEEAYEWGSIMIGMILSLADIVPVDDDNQVKPEGYAEGDLQRIEVNRYERNPLNRKLCLATKGYDCSICGMNFERQYGEIGHQFIHVHHIVPVSQVGAGYVINPTKDLIPVCPNCHAMLHRKVPPYLPAELKSIIYESNSVTK